jgi:hypothetical protein
MVERRYPVSPQQPSGEHHSVCPICGALVDELDLEESAAEPDHPPPAKH